MREIRKGLRKDLSKFSDQDLINILLFSIYKLTDDPGYSTISELIYCLDKQNLFNLCATFGGCTIKIPTLDELGKLTKSLLVFQSINEGLSFNQACNKHKIDSMDRKYVFSMYNILKGILSTYEE